MKSKQQLLYNLLLKIPKGKVTTYKELAKVLKSHPRAVGKMLNCNKEPEKYPCYKVIMSSGKLGGYESGTNKKISLLRKDSVEIHKNKISDKYVYKYH
ncbi:MAG: MGMT family protein [Candidatus Aenigmarchaeota archaeon]|nr:MGMT family protein [Candidatus Aenigmarchaeota archaeon]